MGNIRTPRKIAILLFGLGGLGAILALVPTPCRAETQFVLMGGYNLSSPRTAASESFGDFASWAFGVGLNVHLAEAAYFEPDLLYVNRRYSDTYSMPTVELPLLFKYEKKIFMAGAGPYFALITGASGDITGPIALSTLSMSSFDLGMMIEGGIRLPVTRNINAFVDARLSRAFTASYGGADPFYWTTAQVLIGIQIASKKR
jgi:hypothetical protein